MNDEASSSAAAYPPPNGDVSPPSETAPTAAELVERRKKNRNMFNRKRGDLLDDLLRNLDILIYAELSTIYYMDCSFFRFLLRAFVQFVFLTPKPAIFPNQPQDRPVIGALLASNIICLVCHIWFDTPSAGEATREYLHGGMAMDFIGQKGPTSKIHLVLLDVIVVILQLVHLSANMVRRRLRAASSTAPAAGQAPTATSQTAQDLDSEERGVRRSHEQHDIEMQTLNPEGAAATNNEQTEPPDQSEALLASTAPRTDAHIFDAFHSGQIVLADLDVWKSVIEQLQMIKDVRNAPAPSMQIFRNELAARMLRMRMGTDAIRQTL